MIAIHRRQFNSLALLLGAQGKKLFAGSDHRGTTD